MMILIVYPKKILIKILENKLAYLQKKKKKKFFGNNDQLLRNRTH